MSENKLADLSMDYAVNIVKLCDSIKGRYTLTNQLIRSGTSVGANIHEANYAHGRADFAAKMHIALKECYESEYWIELLFRTDVITKEQFECMKNQSGPIRRMLIASINTVKGL